MASSMVIPASKDTLFMRGFSSRQDIDDLRGFFSREGRCTVEFFKQSENKDKLYVALRFESKDMARDILNKFDNKEVLGDRITISWFKDLRRARAQVTDFNRHRWGGYYDRDQHQHYSGNRWHHSPIGSRSRRYDRSSSHSRSSSRSPSGSRSRSRSRDRHHHRSNSADSRDSGKRSHSRNGGRGRHQKSPAHDDSTDKEADQASRGRSHKLINTSDERSPGVEKKGSKDGNHGDDDRHVICSHSSLDRVSDVDNSFEQSPPKSAKYLRSAVTTVEPPVDNNSNNKVLDTSNEQKLGYTTSYPQQQQRYQSARYFSDDSPPAEKANEAATKRRKENRYNNDFNRCYEGYERTDPDTADRASYSPDHKRGSARSQESDTIADNPESPSPLPKDGYPYRDNRSAWRPDTKSDDHSSAVQRSYRSTGDGYGRERSPPDVMDDDSWRNRKRQQSVLSDEEEEFDSQHRNIIDGEAKKKRIIDDALPTKELKRDRFDERSCSSSRTSSRGREDPGGEAKKKTAPGMLNNRFCREMEKGALGLSQDRMALVREKKDEIEKAYRQDCETFAVVVKMLVSKDTKLEDQLQFSLRENLKDIGQRCIHELREFIEQLKSEEEMQL